MQPLIDSLEALKSEFAGELSVCFRALEREIKDAEEWIAEKLAEDGLPQSRHRACSTTLMGMTNPRLTPAFSTI